jgi:uncharacterized protein
MMAISRRGFLRGVLRGGVGMSLAGVGAYVYGGKVEAWWFEVVRQELALPGLPDAFAGFTIAQISDLHFGPLACSDDLAPAIDSVQALGADAVVVTGDLVSRTTHGEDDMVVESLSRLTAPEGVFAVLGNHDWWSDSDVVVESLQRAGVQVLQNRHAVWRRGGQMLYVVGLDDVCVHRDDLAGALDGIPASARVLLLVHEPDFADVAVNDPRILLQLSGHSHGGQVCIPGFGGLVFPRYARKYSRGLYAVGSLTLYTNRGLGMIGLPVRVACRPEITLFTLRPA